MDTAVGFEWPEDRVCLQSSGERWGGVWSGGENADGQDRASVHHQGTIKVVKAE